MSHTENSTKKEQTTTNKEQIGLTNANVKLTADFFPNCWQDDERMENFFAPFRVKSVNPVNYETKLKFWKNFIKEYCEVKGSAAMSINELRDALQRNGKKPHCLVTVFEEQLNDGSIRRKSEFMEAPQLTWGAWAIDKLIKTPIKWSFNKVKESALPAAIVVTPQLETTEFVVLEVVKTQAEKLLAFFNSQNDYLGVISTEELYKQLAREKTFSLDGAELALHYLYCQQRASLQKATIDKKEVTLCKFAMDMSRNVEPITPLDISIYTLNKMEKSLTKSLDGIENDINKTDSQVRQYIREKKKQLAKSFLRKKHALEKNLAKTSNALATVQSLLLQIDDTKHNANIIEALKMGTNTLKNALDDKNVNVDTVEDVLMDVKEVLDTNAEIQFALSGAQFNDIVNDGVDDESLEAELNDLLDDVKTDATVAGGTGGSGNGSTANEFPILPDSLAAKTQKPATITNVIDDLLEERLKRLELDNTINVTIGGPNRNQTGHVVIAQGSGQ